MDVGRVGFSGHQWLQMNSSFFAVCSSGESPSINLAMFKPLAVSVSQKYIGLKNSGSVFHSIDIYMTMTWLMNDE